jgi:RNase H-fold protein (predicted Holliday junction resolvase)
MMKPSLNSSPPLLAVDPGREKCGMAVVTLARQVLEREILPLEMLTMRVAHYIGRYGIDTIVVGDRTGAKDVRELLRRGGFQLEIIFVDEDRSSELGRRRYLQDHPGRGWARLLPITLRVPDQPFDDYVAVILAERYLDGRRSTRLRRQRGGGQVSRKISL